MVHDCYISPNEEELLLCTTNKNELRWFPRKYIVERQYQQLVSKNVDIFRSRLSETNFKIVYSCNTWKAEIYGAEILTQVALLFLGTPDLLKGIVIFLIIKFY